ncbi:MAG: hypothetical protein WBN41_14020 [Lysobacterales bacterium]
MQTLARFYFIFASLLVSGPLLAQLTNNDLDALVEARDNWGQSKN